MKQKQNNGVMYAIHELFCHFVWHGTVPQMSNSDHHKVIIVDQEIDCLQLAFS